MTRQFTAIIEREDDGYVALCPRKPGPRKCGNGCEKRST
jgi:hypothetical protein